MKLHLGCGRKRWAGFLNIDLHDSELDCDIRALPFDDEAADEIHAIHVCEHFLITEIVAVLREWRRVLRKDGTLCIELPCWDKVKQHIANDGPENLTRWALYGEPRTHKEGVPALHKWCYARAEMAQLLGICGFTRVEEETPLFHQPIRDMRFIAVK